MTLIEFKAWFSGYTEDMDGPPSAKQWKRIKKMVDDIDGTAVTERIYLDRYWPPYRPYSFEFAGIGIGSGTTETISTWSSNGTSDAMFAAGKAEALGSITN